MDFRGPVPADLAEVRSLNIAFLHCLQHERAASRWRAALPEQVRPLLGGLGDLQRRRLAAAPFLLLSMRESEPAFWLPRFSADASADLFDDRHGDNSACGRLACAALSFTWALARQNSYAARLLCGASLEWCDTLAEQPLLPLLGVAASPETLQPRLAAHPGFWQRLLQQGLSPDPAIRGAAQLAALQTMLTRQQAGTQPALRTAACDTRAPSLELKAP